MPKELLDKEKFWALFDTLQDPDETWVLREIERTSFPHPSKVKEEIGLDIDVEKIKKINKKLLSFKKKNSIIIPLGLMPKRNFPLIKIKAKDEILPAVPRAWINDLILEEIIKSFEEIYDDWCKGDSKEKNTLKKLIDLLVKVNSDEIEGLEKLGQAISRKLLSTIRKPKTGGNEYVYDIPSSSSFVRILSRYFPRTYGKLQQIFRCEKCNKGNKLKTEKEELHEFFDLIFAFSLTVDFPFHPLRYPYLILVLAPFLLYESPVVDSYENDNFDLWEASKLWKRTLKCLLFEVEEKEEMWELKEDAEEITQVIEFIWYLLFSVMYTIFAVFIPEKHLKGQKILKLTIEYEEEYQPVGAVFHFLKIFSRRRCREKAFRWTSYGLLRKLLSGVCYFGELFFHILPTKMPFSRSIIITRPNYLGGKTFHYEVNFSPLNEVVDVLIYYDNVEGYLSALEEKSLAFRQIRQEVHRIHGYANAAENDYLRVDEHIYSSSSEKLPIITEVRTRRTIGAFLLSTLLLFFLLIYYPPLKFFVSCVKTWKNSKIVVIHPTPSIEFSLLPRKKTAESESRSPNSIKRIGKNTVLRLQPIKGKTSSVYSFFQACRTSLERSCCGTEKQDPCEAKIPFSVYEIGLPWLLALFSLLFRDFFSTQGLMYLLYASIATFVSAILLATINIVIGVSCFYQLVIAIINFLLILGFLWYYRIRVPLFLFRGRTENLLREIKRGGKKNV